MWPGYLPGAYRRDRRPQPVADRAWALIWRRLIRGCHAATSGLELQGGDDNNHIVEMQIMLKDPKGHYSYKYRERAAAQQ